MPQRFLKPGIRTSKRWDSCSWPAQSFYVRLITLVDDFGRYECDEVRLKNEAFPLREDIRASQVSAYLKELEKHHLLIFYKADGKTYLAITQWTERARYQSKYPDPPNAMAAAESGCKMTIDNSSRTTDNFSPQQTSSSSPTSKPKKLSFAKAFDEKLRQEANGSTEGPWKGQLRAILANDPDLQEPNNLRAWELFFAKETDDFAKVLVKKYEANKATIDRIGAYLSKVAKERGRWVK